MYLELHVEIEDQDWVDSLPFPTDPPTVKNIH